MIRKILIVSDSHGKSKNIKQAIDREKPDMLIHLGDIEDDPEMVRGWLDSAAQKWNEKNHDAADRKSLPIPAVFIEGNCDRYRRVSDDDEKSSLKKLSVFKLNGHGFYCTHGHREGVNYGLENLIYSAMENECDIVMYGHTHMPMDESYESRMDGPEESRMEESSELSEAVRSVRIINPGSISLPRGGSRKSYMVMTFEGDDYSVEMKFI